MRNSVSDRTDGLRRGALGAFAFLVVWAASAACAETAAFEAPMIAPTRKAETRSARARAVPATRRRTWSGYPTPRFVSLKGERTNCRLGPSKAHPIRYVFQRAGLPVMVVAETRDKWRKIRDLDGDECWAFYTTLTARNHVVARRATAVYARRDLDAPVRVRLSAGAFVKAFGPARPEGGALWVKVSAQGVSGWTPALDVWGGDAEAERQRLSAPTPQANASLAASRN
ncbi:MAG: SH3 domain-containing protein [Pseudomonadota bacterium]